MNTVLVDNRHIVPSKIVCVGRNYVEHIAELGNEVPDEMVIFLKPNSAISDELRAFHQEQLHYEGELCFMVGNGRFQAVGFGLDLTKRALQTKLKKKGLPWERAKTFDGAALFTQFIPIIQTSMDTLSLELEINGVLVQSGGVPLMIHKPNEILTEISRFITLNEGDIVMTGTPKGVGTINAGDKFTGRIIDQSRVILHRSWIAK